MNFLSAYQVSFSHNLKCLYTNSLLSGISEAMLGIFGVIFLYEQLDHSVLRVVAFFLLFYGSMMICGHAGAKLIGGFGMKKMLIIGTILSVVSTVFLWLIPVHATLFLSLYFIFFVAYTAFYWVAYHIEFAAFTDKKTRGKQSAIIANVSALVLAVTPVITGIILVSFGFSVVFMLAALLIVASVIPLFSLHETHENYTWSYSMLIAALYKKENRGMVFSQITNGMQAAIHAVIWPVFIFITLQGDYFSIGVITTIVTLAIIVLRFVIGYFLDIIKKETLVRVGSIIESTGWFVKIFIENGVGIFLADTYHKFGATTRGISQETNVYEEAADSGRLIDEYIVLKELSLMIGRVLSLALSLILITFVSIKSTFILAAIASLLIALSIRKVTLV